MGVCHVCGADRTGTVCGLCGAPAEESSGGTEWMVAPAAPPTPTPTPPPAVPVVKSRPEDVAPSAGAQVTGPPKAVFAAVGVVALLGIAFFGVRSLQEREEPTTYQAVVAPSHTPEPVVVTGSSGVAAESDSWTSSASTTSSPTALEIQATTDEAEALRMLEEVYRRDKNELRIDGHWFTVLSSKWVGVVDPQQSTRDGSHTFMAKDILDDYLTLRAQHPGVRLYQSTDFGKQYTYSKKPAGEPIWVITHDDGSLQTEEEATAWCESQFPGLSAQTLKNRCFGKQARTPYPA